MYLLSLKHFVELLLTPIEQKLLKVHFGVLGVVELIEKANAKLDVQVEESGLSRALHENDFH